MAVLNTGMTVLVSLDRLQMCKKAINILLVNTFVFMPCHKGSAEAHECEEFQKVCGSCAVLIKNCLSAFLTTAVTAVNQPSSEVFEFLNPKTKRLNSTNYLRFLVSIYF